LPGAYFAVPPVVCYLDRGHGAAIRRARTRLPGGEENPVAVIRVPRERMVGSGIASSLVHEVGHQAAAVLDLVTSIRPALRRLEGGGYWHHTIWALWDRWISEILADFWSVARVGVSSTLGLMGVVSLPRAFVFRVSTDDPHPIPWVRVKLSAAIGQALYPDPQWGNLSKIWESYYPSVRLTAQRRQLLAAAETEMPDFIDLLVNHRPPSLRGASLREATAERERSPDSLRRQYQSWRSVPHEMRSAAPSLVFAVVGQARADGELNPEAEGQLFARLLTGWALEGTLPTPVSFAGRLRSRAAGPAP
jgi:hypothetical protein